MNVFATVCMNVFVYVCSVHYLFAVKGNPSRHSFRPHQPTPSPRQYSPSFPSFPPQKFPPRRNNNETCRKKIPPTQNFPLNIPPSPIIFFPPTSLIVSPTERSKIFFLGWQKKFCSRIQESGAGGESAERGCGNQPANCYRSRKLSWNIQGVH